jgi:hypothetical protein
VVDPVALTVILNAWLLVPPSVSFTTTVITAVPLAPVTGVAVIVRLVPVPENTRFALGKSPWFELVPETVKLFAGVSWSPIVNPSTTAVLSATVVLFKPEMVGKSLTLCTVTETEAFAVRDPSLAVNVSVAVPNWLSCGVKLMLRVQPLTAMETLDAGINAGFEEATVTVKLAQGVVSSPTVKLKLIAVSSEPVCGPGLLIVGARFEVATT